MMIPVSPLFCVEILDCMAEARPPTETERMTVAQRIWSDGAPYRPAFEWDKLPKASPARLDSMRAAELALCGLP